MIDSFIQILFEFFCSSRTRLLTPSHSIYFCLCVCAWLYLRWFTLKFVFPTLIRNGSKKYGISTRATVSTTATAISKPTSVIFASTATNYNPRWVKPWKFKARTKKNYSSKASETLSEWVCVVCNRLALLQTKYSSV